MLACVLDGLIIWPQTNIGLINPPYKFLPNSVAIIDGTKILFSLQVIYLPEVVL